MKDTNNAEMKEEKKAKDKNYAEMKKEKKSKNSSGRKATIDEN